ncbi:hypothetical protein J4206_02915 [Candidatus Woesearchaeota archaeon]|nr:hypothetical protein [Candidatus Woesearchaeota archaeon]
MQNVAQQIVAADAAGVASYSVNDSNFAVNNTGFLVNNTQLAVGTYNLNVTAVDANGNAQSSFGVITVADTTQPVFSVNVASETKEFAQQNVAQQLVANDAAGVASYSVNDSSFAINNTGFLVNNTQLAVGTYNLNVTAVDANGNAQSSFGVITISDTTAPIISVGVAPETKEFAQQAVGQQIVAADAAGVVYSVNDTDFQINSSGFLSNATQLDTGETNTKTYNIMVTVTDPSNNAASSTGVITVQDTVNPVFTTGVTTQNREFAQQGVSQALVATDAAGIAGYSVNDTTNFQIDAATGLLTNKTQLAVGTYNIKVFATDNHGRNSNSVGVITAADTTQPVFTTNVATEAKEFALQNVAQTIVATDAAGVAYSVNDTNFAINPSTGALTNNTQLAVGAYNLNVTATDPSGNAQSSFGVITVSDTTQPVFSVNVASETKEFAQQNVAQQIVASDQSSIAAYAVNDSNFAINSTGYLVNNTQLPVGTYNINVTATDTQGNAQSSFGVITVVDTTAPIFSTPVASETREFAQQNVAQQIVAADAAGVASYSVNDSNFAVNNSGYLTNATQLAVGAYNVKVTATDGNGVQGNSVGVITVLDTTAPVITTGITTQNREFAQQAVAQQLVASDAAGISSYSVNDTNFAVNSSGFLTNATLLDNKIYNLKVTVTDGNGMQSTTTGVITVQDNTAPVFDNGVQSETREFALEGVSQFIIANDAAGIAGYTVNDTTNFQINAVTGLLTNKTQLAVGAYNVKVFVTDNNGQNANNVGVITIADATAPSFTAPITNETKEFALQGVSQQLVAADAAGVASYAVNDTTDFAISGSGLLTNNTQLSVGTHNLKVNATDNNGNVKQIVGVITVVDTTKPVFSANAASETKEFAQQNVAQQIVAEDASGVASYSVNNSNFAINNSGYLTNNTQLAVGTYNLNVTALDANGNAQSSFGVITVQDTNAPQFTTGVTTQNREFKTQGVAQTIVATDAAGIATYAVNDTTNFAINPTTGALTNATLLPVGAYNVKVTATDGNGVQNTSTGVITVQDTTVPVFDQPVTSEPKEFAQEAVFQVIVANDLAGVTYSVNDTDFVINPTTGVLKNNTLLTVGAHNLKVNATDPSGNSAASNGVITVVDTTKPVFSVNVASETKEFAQQNVAQQIVAADAAGVASYSVNDTNFAVNNTGYLTNNTQLAVGVYNLNVTAVDVNGNAQSSFGMITVTDTTQPVFSVNVASETKEFAQQNVAQQLAASDASGIASYSVNDSNFAINNTGYLTNNTQLAVGTYNLNVTALDANGNAQSSFGVITVADTTKPLFTSNVVSETKEFAQQDVAQQIVAVDAAGVVSYSVNDSNFAVNNSGILTNNTQLAVGTYNLNVTATDANNNQQTNTGVITVSDTTLPVFTTPVATETKEFASQGVSQNIVATDAAGVSYAVNDTNFAINPTTGALTNNTQLAVGTYNVKVTATDPSNNQQTSTGVITVSDTTLPVFTTPVATETKEFALQGVSQNIVAADAAGVTYSVNDTANFAINSVSGVLTNATQLAVGTYNLNITAVDANGNAQSSFGVIIVSDNTDPVFTTPVATETKEFAQEAVSQNIVANDAAGILSYIVNDTNFAINPTTGVLTNNTQLAVGAYNVKVTATDNNNNQAISIGVITVQDTTLPVFSTPVASQTKEFALQNVAQTVVATDAAGVTYSVNDTDNFAINPITGALTNATQLAVGAYNVKVTATDPSNNQQTSTGVITEADTTQPVFGTPVASQTKEFALQNVAQTIVATDAAGVSYAVNDTDNFAINLASGVLTNATQLAVGTYNVKVTATDANNNAATSTGVISVSDTTVPRVFNSNITNPSEFSQNLTIRVDVADVSEISQIFANISGTILPALFELGQEPDSTFQTILQGLPVGTYNVQYIVNDTYNNLNDTLTDSFVIQDTTKPVFTTEVTTQNREFAQQNVAQQLVATDAAGIASYSVNDPSFAINNSGYLTNNTQLAVGTYNLNVTAVDANGNAQSSFGVITVSDTTAPVFSVNVAPQTKEFAQQNVAQQIVANDAAGVVSYLVNDSSFAINNTGFLVNNTQLAVGTYNLNITAVDANGNAQSSFGMITVQDNTAPVFSVNVATETKEFALQNVTQTIVASDAAGVTYSINDTNFAIDPSTGALTNATQLAVGTYNVKVTATDPSNNQQTSTGVITVSDTTLPVFSVNVATETKEFALQNVAQTVVATDAASVTYSVNDTNFAIDTSTGALTNATQLAVGTYNVKVTATDASNNAATSTGIITVSDTTQPVFSVNVASETKEFALQNVAQQIVAADAASVASYSVNDSSFAINNSGYLTNNTQLAVGTYNLNVTAVDANGNAQSSFGVITVSDATAPTFSVNVASETKEFAQQDVSQNIVANDAAGILNYAVNDTNFAINPTTGALTNNTQLAVGAYNVKVTATDNNNNQAISIGVITVQDNTAPTFSTPVASQTKEFAQDNVAQTIVATDAAGVTYSVNDTNFAIDPTTGVLTNNTQLAVGAYNVKVTATDPNNNQQTSIGVITVQDTTVPVFTTNVATEKTIVATDAAGVTYSVNDTTNFAINPTTGALTNATQLAVGTYNVNVTATDASNNQQASTGVITVQDTTLPVFTTNVASETKEFALQNVAQTVVATDAAGILSYSVNDSNFAVSSSGLLTNNTQLAVGTYNLNVTAIDANGNAQSSFGVITVEDNTVPSVSNSVIQDSTIYENNVTLSVDASDQSSVSKVVANVSGTLLPMTLSSGNTYTATVVQPVVGSYNVQYLVNDTFNNVNNLLTDSFVVTKADPNLQLFLDGVSTNITVMENTLVNLTGTSKGAGLVHLFKNDSEQSNGVSPHTNLSNFSAPGKYNVTATVDEDPNYNSATKTLFVVVEPNVVHDLAIVSFTVTNSVAVNTQLSLPVIINNQGTLSESSVVRLLQNGSEIASQSITLLAPGENVTKTFTWTAPDFEVQNLELKVKVDTVTGETDTADNSNTKFVNVYGTHDVSVDDIAFSKQTAYLFDTMTVSANVTNRGNVNESSVPVQFKDLNGGTTIQNLNLANLKVGETRNVQFTWNPQAKNFHTLKILTLLGSDSNASNDEKSQSVKVISVKDSINLTFVSEASFPAPSQTQNQEFYTWVNIDSKVSDVLKDLNVTLDSDGTSVTSNSQDGTTNSFRNYNTFSAFDSQSYYWAVNAGPGPTTKVMNVSMGFGTDKIFVARSVSIS